MGILDRVKQVEDEKKNIHYREGYEEGRKDGYDCGYEDGYEAAKLKFKQKEFYEPLSSEEA